ncbi:MAG: sporulation protein YunB [Clostridia bacterium]|nr:sporulation protein YunB [Clostridia bacterium]
MPRIRFSRRFRRFAIRLLCYFLFVLIALILIYNKQIYPYVAAITRSQAENNVQQVFSDAVANAAEEMALTYSDLIVLHTDGGGAIDALSVNTAKVNAVRSRLLTDALASLRETEIETVHIPLGTLLAGELSSGRGPQIPVKVLVARVLRCGVVSTFEETGINQTLHRIYLSLSCEATAMLPSGMISFTVTTDCCIGETVLVGKTPESFTKIDRLTDDVTEDEIGNLINYGSLGKK